jgi:hypothetical protein
MTMTMGEFMWRQTRPLIDAPESERWLDKRALAAHYSVSVRTVEEWQHDGMPHAVIAGRVKYHASEAERWLTEQGLIERRRNAAR